MSTTSSQFVPTVDERHHESRSPSPTTCAPSPNGIHLTVLESVSQNSAYSSPLTAQATHPVSSPSTEPIQGNAQALAVQTWYRRILIHVRKTFAGCCTACGPPQLLVGLISLGLAIPVVKLSIYLYQLSQWTAWKDFRQDCRSLNVSASPKM
jgi:hypothetical protein